MLRPELSPALLLQKAQNYILFTAFWLTLTVSDLPRSPFSPAVGLILFAVFDILFSLVFLIPGIRRRGMPVQLLLISGALLVFPLTGIAGGFAAGLPFPGDLLLLRFRAYLVYVVPALVLARLLELAAGRGKILFLSLANLLIISLVMSRSGWALRLPAESLKVAYLLIFLFLCLQTLMILSGGRRGYRLSFFSVLLVFLIPLLGLVPLSRLQRNESRKEGGGLLESSLFRFDFSDYLSLESSISMKDDLVFLMKKERGGGKSLTRRFVLSAYSADRGFYRESGEGYESPGRVLNEYVLPEAPRRWDLPEYGQTEEVVQEYYLVNFDTSAFLGFNAPVSVTPYVSWDDSSFSRIYRVDSMVSEAWGWDLVEAEALAGNNPENRTFLEYYTRSGGRDDLAELAEEITADSRTYYDRVVDIEEYLKNNYFYSLTPGESVDGDQLSHFLYESKKGYCSYFAFSMALLCRSIGIPARVALGFWVDESSKVLDYYPVRANQAHAWVEVYFPGYGWLEFDPTSTIIAPGDDFRITPLSAREMEPYLKEILENRDSLRIQTAGEAAESSRSSGRGGGAAVRAGLRLLPPAVLIVLALFSLRIRQLLFAVPRKGRSARVFFHLHMSLPAARFRSRGALESPEEYAADLRQQLPELGPLVEMYGKVRFGLSSREDLLCLKEEGRALRRALFGSASFTGRIRYLLILLMLLLRPSGRGGRRRRSI